MINKLLSILKAYADYANVLDCYTHILSRYSQSIIESQRASLRNEIERLQNRFGNFANEFEKCKNSFSFSTNILTLLNHFLEEKKRSAFVKKVFVLFDELLRKLNSGSNRDQQYEKVKEEYKRLLIRHRELPEALYKELNEKWELVRAEAKEKNLLLPPLSNLANELVPISERKPLQNENLSHDTNPKRTASVLKDKQCMYLKKLEESYRKLMYEHDSGNFEKLNEEKSQCLRYIDAIQPYLEQEYNEFLTQDDKLELRKNTRSVEIAKILWIFHVLKETLNKLHYDQSLKDKQLIVTTIENQAQLAIEKYVSLLIEYKGLPYNLYQELSSKWKNVLSKHSALHPDVLPWPLPDLPELSQLVGIPSFFITYSRGMVDELINSPITKRLKFSTQQTGSLKVVDDNPHILILAPMIFSQGYTPTIEDVKSLCEQRQVNLDDLCVTNCVEDSEMKQVGSAKPATEEDWRKAGIDNVSQLKIANRTFLISCGYNSGAQELFKLFTVSNLLEITERINRSPSLVYCYAGKSRSVLITAAAMFKRCWDEGRSHVSPDPTIPFCSISSVIKYLCIRRPEIKSANKTIEQFSDAGQSLTLLLFCWRVVSTKLNDDRINDWLTKSNFIHDVEITLKKLIVPSHVEEQLLALPESLGDVENFIEVLSKIQDENLKKLLYEAIREKNCCHFLNKLFDIIGTTKPSEEVRTLLTRTFSILIENPRNACDTLKSMYQTVQGDKFVFAIQLAHMYFGLSSGERKFFQNNVIPQINVNEIGKTIYVIFNQAIQPHEEKLPRQDTNYTCSYIGELIKAQTIFENSLISEASRNLGNDLCEMGLFSDSDLPRVSKQIESLLELIEVKSDKRIEEYSRWYNTIITQMVLSYGEKLQKNNQYKSLHHIVVKCINIVFPCDFEFIYISKEKLLADLLFFQISEEYCTDITDHLLKLSDTEIIETAFKKAIEPFIEKEIPYENRDDEKSRKELECKLLAAKQLPYYQSVENRFFPDTQIETSDMQTQITLLLYMHLAVMTINKIENDGIPLDDDAKQAIVNIIYDRIFPRSEFNDSTKFQEALSCIEKELPNIKQQLFQNVAYSVNESLANNNKVDDIKLKLLQALIEKGNYETSNADQLFENLVVDIFEHPLGSEAERELTKILFESIDIKCFDNIESFLYMYVRAIRQYMFKSIQGQELISEVKNDEAWHAIFYSVNILVKSKKIINVHDTNKCSELFTSIINLVNNLSHGPFKIRIVDRSLKTYSVEISANDRDKFKIGCDHVFCIIKSIVGLKDNFFTQTTVIYGILRALNTCLRFCIGAEPLKDFEEIENAYFSSLNVIYGELINFRKQCVDPNKILAVTKIMREFCFKIYQIRKTLDFYIDQARAQIESKQQAQITKGYQDDRAKDIKLLTDELTRLYFYSLTHYPDKLEQFVNNTLKYDYTLKGQGGDTYFISMLRKFISHNFDLDLNNFKDFLLIISVILNNEKCCVTLTCLDKDDTKKLIDLLLDDEKFEFFMISSFDRLYLMGKCLLCLDDSIFRYILNRNDIQQKLLLILSTFTHDETLAFNNKHKKNTDEMFIRNDVLKNPEKEGEDEILNNERLVQEIQDFNTKVIELNTNLKQLPIPTVSEEQLFQISGQIMFCRFHINSLRQKQRIFGSHNSIDSNAYENLIKFLSQRLNLLCPKENDHYLDLLMMHLNQRGNSDEVNSFIIQFAQRINPNNLSSNALSKTKQTLHRIVSFECININTLYLFFIAEIRSMTWKNPLESNTRRSDINEPDYVVNMPSLQDEKDELEQFIRTQFSDLDATNKSFYEERVLDEDVLLHLMKHGKGIEIREFVNSFANDKKRSTIIKAVEKYKGKVRPDIEERLKVWLDETFIKITDFCRIVSFDYFLGYLEKHQDKIPGAIDSFKSWLIDDNCDYVKRCLGVIKDKNYKIHIVELIIGAVAAAAGEKARGPQAVNLIKEWYEQGYIKRDQFKNVVSDEYFAKYYTEETSELIKNELGYKSDLKLDENLCLFLEILKQINQAIKEYDTKIEFFRSLFAAWFVSIPENYHNVLRHFKTGILYIPEDQESQTNISFCSSIHNSELHLHVVAYFTIIAVIAHSQNPNILQIESLKNLGIPNLDLNSLHDIFSNVIARIISNDELPTQTKYTVCSSIFKVQKIDRDNVLGIVNSQSLPESLRTIIKNIVDEVLPKYVPQSPVKKILNPIIGSSKGKVETEKTTLGIDNKLKELKNLYSISDVNNKLAIDIVFLIHKENFSSEAKEKIIDCLYNLIKSHALEGLQLYQLYRRIQLSIGKPFSQFYMSILLTSKIIVDFLYSKSQSDFDSMSVLLCGIEFCCEDFENRSYSIFSFFAKKLQELMPKDVTRCLLPYALLVCLKNLENFEYADKNSIRTYFDKVRNEKFARLLPLYAECGVSTTGEVLTLRQENMQDLKSLSADEKTKVDLAERLVLIFKKIENYDAGLEKDLDKWMEDAVQSNKYENIKHIYRDIFIQLNGFYKITYKLILKLRAFFNDSLIKSCDFMEQIIQAKADSEACVKTFTPSNEEQYKQELQDKCKNLQQLQELVKQEFIDRTASAITLGNLERAFELQREYQTVLKECYLENAVSQMMISVLTSSEPDEKTRREEAIKIAQNYLSALVKYGLTHKLAVDFPQVIDVLMENVNQKEQQTVKWVKNELMKIYSFEELLQEAVNQWASLISKAGDTDDDLYYDYRQLLGVDINPTGNNDQDQLKRTRYSELAEKCGGKFVPVNQERRTNDEVKLFSALELIVLPTAIVNKQMRSAILLILLDQLGLMFKTIDVTSNMIFKATYKFGTSKTITDPEYPYINITPGDNKYIITFSGSFNFLPNDSEKPYKCSNKVIIYLVKNQDDTLSITLQNFEYSIELEGIQMKFYLPKFPVVPTSIPQLPSFSPDETQLEPSPQVGDNGNSNDHSSGALASLSAQTGFFAETESRNNQEESCLINDNAPRP